MSNMLELESCLVLGFVSSKKGGEIRLPTCVHCHVANSTLRQLFDAMVPHIDLPRAVLRGQYMKAAARMERTGVPLDVPLLETLREYWLPIEQRLISEVDQQYGVYEDTKFSLKRFDAWCVKNGIEWPRTPTGRPDLKDDTFKDMAR